MSDNTKTCPYCGMESVVIHQDGKDWTLCPQDHVWSIEVKKKSVAKLVTTFTRGDINE